jgi:outer membrane protein assembly factor BamB
MRLVIVIILLAMLQACVSATKDYSAAKKLKPINVSIIVKPLWVKPTGAVPVYAHAQLQPTVVGSNVYLASVDGDVRLMDANKGELIWSVSLDESLTSAPGVGENLLFVGSRSAEIIALDKNTGAERWRISVTSEMLARPLVSGNSLFVQTIDGKMTALDTATGKLLWNYNHDIPKLTLRGTASPIISGNQVIAGFADGKLVSLDAETGEVRWKSVVTVPRGRTDLERLADIDGLFQVSNGSVYVTSYQGRVAAVSLTDGTVQWARKMSSYNGVAVSASRIYISDTEGQVWSLDARTGATLWRQNNLEGREISTPVVMNNVVVVADFEGYAHWLSVDDGQIIARQSMDEVWNEVFEPDYDSLYEVEESDIFPRLVTTPPFAINNTLYIRDNTGAFAAFQVESTTH